MCPLGGSARTCGEACVDLLDLMPANRPIGHQSDTKSPVIALNPLKCSKDTQPPPCCRGQGSAVCGSGLGAKVSNVQEVPFHGAWLEPALRSRQTMPPWSLRHAKTPPHLRRGGFARRCNCSHCLQQCLEKATVPGTCGKSCLGGAVEGLVLLQPFRSTPENLPECEQVWDSWRPYCQMK